MSKKFKHNGEKNNFAQHDLGLAIGTLSVQASILGISIHQMAGLDTVIAHKNLNLSSDIEVVTAMAIGYAAEPTSLSSEEQKVEYTAQERLNLNEFVL